MITNKSSVIRLGSSQPWPIRSHSLVWFQYHLNARLKLFFQKYFDDKFFQNRGISFSHVLLKFFSGRLFLEVFLHDSKLYDFYSTKPSHKAVALVRGFRQRRFYKKNFNRSKKLRKKQFSKFLLSKRKKSVKGVDRFTSLSFLRIFSIKAQLHRGKGVLVSKVVRPLSNSIFSAESLFKKSYYFKKRFVSTARWSKFLLFRLRKRRKVKIFKPVLPKFKPKSIFNFRYNYLLYRRRSKLVDFLEYKSRKKFKNYLKKKQKFFSNNFRRNRRFGYFNRNANRNKRFSRYGNRYNRRNKYVNNYKRRARRRVMNRFYKFYARRRRFIVRYFSKVARLRLRKLYAQTLSELTYHVSSTFANLSPIFRRFMLRRFWLQYQLRKKDILTNLATRRRFKILYLRKHPYLRRWGLRFFGRKIRAKRKVITKRRNLKKTTKKNSKRLRVKSSSHRRGNRRVRRSFSKGRRKGLRTGKRFSPRKFGRRGAPVVSGDARADRFVFFNQYSAFASANFVRYRFYHFLARFLSAQLYANFKFPVKISFNFFPIHRAGSDFYLNYITAKLYYRYILSDIIKPIVKMSMTFYRGFVVSCKGRFTRAQIAVSKKFVKRSVSYSRISSLLDYGQRAVVLKYGTCNLRIWIRK